MKTTAGNCVMCLYSSFQSGRNRWADGSQIVSIAPIVLLYIVATSWAAGLVEASSRRFATHPKGFFSPRWLVGSMGYLSSWGWHKRLTGVRRLCIYKGSVAHFYTLDTFVQYRTPVLVFWEQLGSHFLNKLCSRQPFHANSAMVPKYGKAKFILIKWTRLWGPALFKTCARVPNVFLFFLLVCVPELLFFFFGFLKKTF